jgi:hypothetical protein
VADLFSPGDVVIDYSYARPSLTEAKLNGAKAVIRYSAGAASDPAHPSHAANAGKLISADEFKAILAAGLDVIANDEWYETRVTEGYAAGVQDGRAATALWKTAGLAQGATVYCSWDAKPTVLKRWKVRRYLKGWRVGSAYYLPDLYAGTPALRALAVRFGWRPNAGSWSNDGLPYQPYTGTAAARTSLVAEALPKTPAHIWQTGNYWFKKQADENLILRVPVGSHLETTAAPVTHPNVDQAESDLSKVAALYKGGRIGRAVRAALAALKGIR